MSILKIKIKDREIFLKTSLFEDEGEIDLDQILRIDHTRIDAEILTFPVVINRLGILLADADNELKEAQLGLDIWYSQQKERIRNDWDTDAKRPVVRGYKYTIDQVTDAVESDPVYLNKRKKINRLIKQHAYINSIYWSAKSKDDKLAILTKFIGEDTDFGELDGTMFNGVEIRGKQPLIKAGKH